MQNGGRMEATAAFCVHRAPGLLAKQFSSGPTLVRLTLQNTALTFSSHGACPLVVSSILSSFSRHPSILRTVFSERSIREILSLLPWHFKRCIALLRDTPAPPSNFLAVPPFTEMSTLALTVGRCWQPVSAVCGCAASAALASQGCHTAPIEALSAQGMGQPTGDGRLSHGRGTSAGEGLESQAWRMEIGWGRRSSNLTCLCLKQPPERCLPIYLCAFRPSTS